MPVHHQEQQVIPRPLPTSFRSFKECLDLSWIKEILSSMRISNATFHITRYGKVTHGVGFLRVRGGFNRPLSTKLR
jgi:hypothetical protein